MSRSNLLLKSPPYNVEKALRDLGENLRLARLRRNMTIAEAAEKIGTGPRAVMDAEKGKGSTGIAVYAALLWLYDLLWQFGDVAEPESDKQGVLLDSLRQRQRARKRIELDNKF
ncbi:helix-turn-helix transcriptional regulator [soil metagenome]